MYVNDLNYFVSNTSLTLYADDTMEYASDVSPTVLQCVINSHLSGLPRWFGLNYLKINAARTQAVAIWPSLYEYEFHLINEKVEKQDTLKILRVVFNSKLTLKAHIKEQLKKACAKATSKSDSIVRQTNKVHLLSYTVMTNKHIFYYTTFSCV